MLAQVPAQDTRTLVLHLHGPDSAVRDDAGRLLWLETPDGYAYRTDREGIVTVARDANVLLPPDVGAEALAMASVSHLCDWLGHLGQVPAPTQGELVVRSEEWGEVEVRVDGQTGVVTNVRGADPRTGDELALTADVRKISEPSADWFSPTDR